jgi:hypothetical protein
MTDDQRQFDRDTRFAVTPKFADDLGKLFEPQGSVPADIDRAVAEAARRHLARPVRKLWWLKWTVPATAAAAIILACVWWLAPTDGPQPAQPIAVAEDVDGNGTVNILDALVLAKRIEAATASESQWDLNRDGLVDRQDVDVIAMAAVRLNKGV